LERYKVIVTPLAQDDLRRLSPEVRLRVLKSMKRLEIFPFPTGKQIKRLKGTRIPLFRLRAGDYRVVYRIDERNVPILMVTHQRELERRLKEIL